MTWVEEIEGTPTLLAQRGSAGAAVGVPPPAGDPAVAVSAAPNPARSAIQIVVEGAHDGRASLQVFDAAGHRVRALGATVRGGTARVPWDLRDAAGRRVAPGHYCGFYESCRPSSGEILTLKNNTFERNGFFGSSQDEISPGPGSLIHANVFTGSQVGLRVDPSATGVTIQCNDSWGNNTNWVGFTPSPDNFSETPRYCDLDGEDFTVASNSPLLAPNNSFGVRVGAFGQGCGPISIQSLSWGGVKALYRE